ncbi:MAG: porin [Proteobacteria bacterium]|nr:porin [Pseudomonadota bacterium]
MKKALIGTSALIAVGLLSAQAANAADAISLGLSGNYRVVGGFVNQDDGTGQGAANTRSHQIGTDGAVAISGSTTLDNGMKVGVRAELELADAGTAGDTIDEHYIWLENTDAWGRIELGDRDGAHNKMNTLAPFVFGVSIVGVQTMQMATAPAGSGGFILLVPRPSDATKVTYYTPRFSGVQLGMSYTPDNAENIGRFGAGTTTENDAGALDSFIDVGANWNGKLGDASVRVSGAYSTASAEATASKDLTEWSVGLNVGMNGWAFGAQYRDEEDTGAGGLSTVAELERISWKISGTYATGPWLLGIEYAQEDTEVTTTTEDQVTVWGVGAKRTLGPGVSAGLAVHIWEWEDDANAVAAQNDATEILLITEISF